MDQHRGFWRPAGLLAAVAASILLAGCGPMKSATSPAPSHSAPSVTPAAGAKFAVTSDSMGKYLTVGGRAVYLWEGDKGKGSSCDGACANAWPPVTTTGKPRVSSGLEADDFGTIKRSDGSTQVTFYGHPLYRFSGDTGGRQTNGEGSNGFGAKWWLVAPSGSAVKGGTASSSPTSGGSGRY
jgi:predicted lipoprotein with Yx(FWY)xxD motif